MEGRIVVDLVEY